MISEPFHYRAIETLEIDRLTQRVATLEGIVLDLMARCDPPLVKRAIRAPRAEPDPRDR